MATSFPNSMRSLQIHSPRKTILGLILSSVLMIVWLVWLLVAQIHLYEVSETILVTGNEVVTVTFPSEAIGLLKRGQTASLMLDGRVGAKIGPVPAIILNVNDNLEENIVEASVLVYWDEVAFDNFPFESGAEGQIQVEIEQISPIALIMRSAKSAIEAASAPTPDNTNDAN